VVNCEKATRTAKIELEAIKNQAKIETKIELESSKDGSN
jgi:hypothetical protein